jgi:hypothetical protein
MVDGSGNETVVRRRIANEHDPDDVIIWTVQTNQLSDFTRVGTGSGCPKAADSSDMQREHHILSCCCDCETFLLLDDSWPVELRRHADADYRWCR